MTQDEIRKLLGGYATNTLSDSERAALFEAALDDQELFEALSNEDALRELLADPVTRAQVQQALQPTAARSAKPFWLAWQWMAGAAGLAAAAIALIVVQWPHPPRPVAPPQQMAANQIAQPPAEPKLEAPAAIVPPSGAPRRKTLDQLKQAPQPGAVQGETQSAKLEAPPVAGRPAEDSNMARLGGAIGGATPPVPEPLPTAKPALAAAPAPLQDPAAAEVANAPSYSGPLLRYSLLRSGAAGDAVRIEVTSQVAGNLALYRADRGGQWQRIFPANGAVLQIIPGMQYQIPDEPLSARGAQDKLRLVIEPALARALASGQTASFGKLNEARTKTVEKAASPAPARLVVEIPLGPN